MHRPLHLLPAGFRSGRLGRPLGRLTPIAVLLAKLVWGFFPDIFCRLLWDHR